MILYTLQFLWGTHFITCVTLTPWWFNLHVLPSQLTVVSDQPSGNIIENSKQFEMELLKEGMQIQPYMYIHMYVYNK